MQLLHRDRVLRILAGARGGSIGAGSEIDG
jgi:hypothetical protein